MKKFIGIFLAGIFLWGCAGDVWLKPGATNEDLMRDRSQCTREILQKATHPGRIWVPEGPRLENQCMVMKGWTLQRPGTSG